MRLVRPLSWTLLAAAGFALVGPPAAGRQPAKDDLPARPKNAGDVVNVYRSAKGIPAADMKRAKETLGAYAQYVADLLATPKVYAAAQEFIPPTVKGGGQVPTVNEIVGDRGLIDLAVLVPEPGGKVGPDNADYIRELGTAFDAALGRLPTAGDQIIAVNGARALATACRSGATAHYKTVTDLLANQNVRPEVKHHLFQAAGHLLAAYDINDLQTRKHSGDPAATAALVAALQKAVEDPAAILPLPPGADGKPAAVPEDLAPVLRFIRREAIRALGQCRFAEFSPSKGQTLYPSYTLARVAMSDPALGVPPGPSEVAEAVIGLCNMNPPRALNAEPYAYAMSDAIASGLITFADKKAAKADDKSLPWRGYAGRLLDALRLWQGLYDANFNPAAPAAYSPTQVPAVVKALAGEAERRVLGPMESGGRIDLEGFKQYRDATLRADKKATPAPYRENPGLVLPRN
ncbi:MAG: hypothetical protein K2X87_23230 [Gemmataceae bacterium]|nr:hypothetical protein [Gemmataceae bacterium]